MVPVWFKASRAIRKVVKTRYVPLVAIGAAFLCAATVFCLQPSLFHDANGTPLYAPFHLSPTIPAMALAHLSVAGFVEFVVTAGVVAYLQRANVPLLRINHRDASVDPGSARTRARVHWRWALIGLGVMVALTPLGLLAPGGALGEGSPGNLDSGKYGPKAVPVGLAKWNGFWHHAVLDGYGFGSGNHPVAGYLVSAAVGLAAICLAVLAVIGVTRLVERGKARGKIKSAPDEVGTLTA